MGAFNTITNNPFRRPSTVSERDDWEDWDEDENSATTILGDEASMARDSDRHDQNGRRDSFQRYSVQRPMFRAKSKGHTKAKIAKAGITLDTNVSKPRQTPKLQRKSTEQSARPENAGRFADAAALKALEGSPNSASIGSFSWLKRKPGNLSAKFTKSSPLSPESRPIVIGIAMPSDTASESQVSPQTAIVETPYVVQHYNQRLASQKTGASSTTPVQLRSVWSPDTEASESPYVVRPASSIYSTMTVRGGGDSSDAPPVPNLPATYKFKQQQQQNLIDLDNEDDSGTPCTLFEEDGSPLASRKSIKPTSALSPEGTGRSKGWWDTVRISQQTTVSQHTNNPFRQFPTQTGESSSSAAAPRDWWHETNQNEKEGSQPQPQLGVMTVGVSPSRDGSSRSFSSSSNSHHTTHLEKSRVLLEENQSQTPMDQPPPYSLNEVKHGVIVPPSNANISQPIPSPGPISPGLPGTMTPQGAIMMADVPPTPRRAPAAVLPDRVVGTYVNHDHLPVAAGTNFKIERNRRRNEKEDHAARRVGGFWRGRGCFSVEGYSYFGRTGREGRKRRRICLAIFGVILALIILAVVLAVILTRKAITPSREVPQTPAQTPAQSPEETEAPVDTLWLNLTGFPPMPTGVLTVAGSDNIDADNGCLEESAKTLWSCSVPKDQQDAASIFEADQPEFIFQIQFDNNTRALWNVSETGEQPTQSNSEGADEVDKPVESKSLIPARKTSTGVVARAAAFVRRAIVYDPGFSPNPAPPDQADMFFLGNTTDDIISDNKAGEPTPFFISLLSSIDQTVGPNVQSRRGLGNGIDTVPENGASASQNISHFVDAPIQSDGRPSPAVLFPLPTQQPVRLFDRGLPTEHYGFYTYFNKSIYIFDLDKDNDADKNGGALLDNATTLVEWSQARFLVKIWTRLNAGLLGNGSKPGFDGESVFAQPGTMPYPVSIIEDFHGGNEVSKATVVWGIGDNQRVDTSNAKLITVNRGAGGNLVNPASAADTSLGGIDGGTGGCRCEWINFVSRS